MARFRYFSDINGTTTEIATLSTMRNHAYRDKWPQVRGLRSDSFSMLVGCQTDSRDYLPITRIIKYKSNPSKHACNAKCLNGSAQGTCECKCGGANHGAGCIV